VSDLKAIVRLPVSSLMIVGKQELPANNAKELIAWLKAKPEPATAASVGAGSGAHVLRALFRAADRHQAAIRVLSRRGACDAGHAGRHDRHHVRRGVADAGACDGAQDESLRRDGAEPRYAGLPDVPTMEEMGISGMDISFWHGLWATKGTPKDVIDKLNAAPSRRSAIRTCKSAFAALGMTIPDKAQLTAAGAARFPQGEVDKWWPIIKSYDIKIQ